MPAILSADDLRFLDTLRYPPIEIERGSTTFICGESGTGKSTLLKLFNATVSPAQGRVLFNGEDIAGMDTISLRRQVLLAGQKVFLFDDTIRGNFAQFYAYRDEPCISEDGMREYLRLCSLEFPLTAPCQPLSGGERQRVFLAIHLSMNPAVLMLDEPSAALDKKTARRMMEQVKAHCAGAGITLIVVSHDSALAGAYADHVISLSGEACE